MRISQVLPIRCDDELVLHSNTFEETVRIDGFVAKEKEEDFLARIAYLKSIE